MEPNRNNSNNKPGGDKNPKSNLFVTLTITVLIVLLISTLLLVITGYFTVVHILEQDIDFLPGQNYSSVTSVEETLPE